MFIGCRSCPMVKMVDACDSYIASVKHEQYIIDILVAKHEDLCIYRVPPNLHQVNAKAYTPQLISISPFHYGKPQCKATEKQKERYYREFYKRIKSDKPFGKFKDYIVVHDIRKCYADKSMPDDDKEFADMIELDAVFIMEFFLSAKEYPERGNGCQHKPTNDAKHLLDLPRYFYIPIDLTPNSPEDSNYHISFSVTKLRDSDKFQSCSRKTMERNVSFGTSLHWSSATIQIIHTPAITFRLLMG
ncbi:hypothetical protein O6P43_017318 [Quillaja saponaria]|uniref:Uncharacterized protein n=1 Tax=Quillaja saponaria TaxID=32244 RepID=A0AAD7PN83_QUISA|nr:hypothetical protein O6P43_017318 [Quillaja saponaria]